MQDPYDSQSYGRYTYCRDNPITYNDPTGHFIPILIGILIGIAVSAVVNVATQAISSSQAHGYLSWNTFASDFSWTSFAIGAAVGGITGGFGTWASPLISAAITPVVGGLAGDILSAAVSGALTGAVAYTSGYLISEAAGIHSNWSWEGFGLACAVGFGAGAFAGGLSSSHLGDFLSGKEDFFGAAIAKGTTTVGAPGTTTESKSIPGKNTSQVDETKPAPNNNQNQPKTADDLNKQTKAPDPNKINNSKVYEREYDIKGLDNAKTHVKENCLIENGNLKYEEIEIDSNGITHTYKIDIQKIEDLVGSDAVRYTSPSGDLILQGKEFRIRFNIDNSHGYDPHYHIEQLIDDIWKDAGKDHMYFLKRD